MHITKQLHNTVTKLSTGITDIRDCNDAVVVKGVMKSSQILINVKSFKEVPFHKKRFLT